MFAIRAHHLVAGARRLLIGSLVALPGFALATPQIPDNLEWNGESYALASLPLEQLGLDMPPAFPLSSACWRGYRGEWSFIEDRLYLTDLRACHGSEQVWAHFLPDTQPPLHADWFSGAIRIPQGKMIQCIYMGFASVYEKDVYLILVEGTLIGTFEVENDFNSMTYADRQLADIGHQSASDGVQVPDLIEGGWLDSMLLRDGIGKLSDEGATATVRGLYFPGRLFLPGNGAAPPWEVILEMEENASEPSPGSAVEVVVSRGTASHTLAVHSVTMLPDGAFLDRRGRVIAGSWLNPEG